MKTLSISINTFNRYPFLKKNLDLLIGQIKKFNLEKEVEIFIGDDKSNDQTPSLIKDYAKKYPFIRYYINKKNLGLPENSFKMISLSKAKYLWMLSDDDYLIKGNLNKIIKNLKKFNPNVYYLNHKAAIVDEKLDIKPSKTFLLPGLKLRKNIFIKTKKEFLRFLCNQGFYNLRIYLAQQSLFINKLKISQDNFLPIKKKFDIRKEFYPVCLSLYYNLPPNNFFIDKESTLAIITNNRSWNATPLKALEVVVKYFDPMQYLIFKKNFNELTFKGKLLFPLSIIYSKIAYLTALISDKLKLSQLLDKFIFGKGSKKISIK